MLIDEPSCYAGIGSRTISDLERALIFEIAKSLAAEGWICYSGNAAGADVAFQVGSADRCVVFLPWLGYNISVYNAPIRSRAFFACGQSGTGLRAIGRYHPNPAALSVGGKMMMARNYHQVMGIEDWPKVKFVLCCANPTEDGVEGGTGQAVRIALGNNIPVINIRDPEWRKILDGVLNKARA